MDSEIKKMYKKQKRRKKFTRIGNTLLLVFIVFGAIGGIMYFSDKSNITEEYVPEYSNSELYSFSVEYIKTNFSDSKVNNFVLTDYKDDNNNINITMSYTFNTEKVESDLNLIYLNGKFYVKNGLVINSIEETEETEIEEFELPGTELNSSEKESAVIFIKNYLGAINSGTAEQFDDGVKKLTENSYYDVETVILSEATNDTLIYVKFNVEYVITDSSGEEIYREIYKYNLSYNEDTQKIEKIIN